MLLFFAVTARTSVEFRLRISNARSSGLLAESFARDLFRPSIAVRVAWFQALEQEEEEEEENSLLLEEDEKDE